ncbi:MAG: hypothetical protein VXW28_07860, partial [Candidatus Thermoplasmatota archaeon]|nr:hypothetical protein [Candidatus Thermoplasmatota archaeon]
GDLTQQTDGNSAVSSSIRAVNMGGYRMPADSLSDIMEYVTIASEGNAIDFGDQTGVLEGGAACASSTRGVLAGGGNIQRMDFVTIMTTGNAQDFGDLNTNSGYPTGAASPTRAVFHIGSAHPSVVNTIEYVQIMSTGNALDFGDLSEGGNHGNPAMQSPTRGIFCGGYGSFAPDVNSPYAYNRMQLITMASKGNSQRFGELNVGGARGG